MFLHNDMNMFNVLGHAISDKITLMGFGATGAMVLMMDSNEFFALLPAILIFIAAVWRHYHKGRKEREEAKKTLLQRQILEEELIEKGLENQILMEKLAQETLKTKRLKPKK